MLDSYQLVSGISIPILENTQCNVQYVNSVCTSTLIQELQQYNVQIKYVNPLQIEPQRINDSNLIKNKITSKINVHSLPNNLTHVDYPPELHICQKSVI